MQTRSAAVAVAWLLVFGLRATQAQVAVNLQPGDFTFEFANPMTGQQIDHIILNYPNGIGSARVAVYLVQTGGSPNVFQQLGVEGMGVRLNYPNSLGQPAIRVPNVLNSNITPPPPPVFNPNSLSSSYGFVGRYGSGTHFDTSTSAAISLGLENRDDPLPFPGTEDPQQNSLRMLVGIFTIQATNNNYGFCQVQAVSGPSIGINNISGPNPPIISLLRNDGTIGPVPGNASQGEILIDHYLAQYLPTPVIPTLTVYVGLPEPSPWPWAAWRLRGSPRGGGGGIRQPSRPEKSDTLLLSSRPRVSPAAGLFYRPILPARRFPSSRPRPPVDF
jgi:hypothetical protein